MRMRWSLGSAGRVEFAGAQLSAGRGFRSPARSPVGSGARAERTVRVTPDYRAPFRFTGGTIDKVVVDVSGERYIDHEAQVRAWLSLD